MNVEVESDRHAQVSCSELFIEITGTYVHGEACQIALQIINRLIEVYRLTTGEFYLETIPANEMRDVTVEIIDDSGIVLGTHRWNFGAGLTLARFSDIPAQAFHLLASGEALPVHSMLLLNAKREHLFENFRIAVVEAETAFEVYLDSAITAHLRKNGIPDSQIAGVLESGLKNIVDVHLAKLMDQAFKGTLEYDAWWKLAYIRRNSIVHDGADTTALEAEEAISAVERAISYISARI